MARGDPLEEVPVEDREEAVVGVVGPRLRGEVQRPRADAEQLLQAEVPQVGLRGGYVVGHGPLQLDLLAQKALEKRLSHESAGAVLAPRQLQDLGRLRQHQPRVQSSEPRLEHALLREVGNLVPWSRRGLGLRLCRPSSNAARSRLVLGRSPEELPLRGLGRLNDVLIQNGHWRRIPHGRQPTPRGAHGGRKPLQAHPGSKVPGACPGRGGGP
mmetsp:Transcript_17450/g.55843  ORF Transcript_17450/g.55843 Transcript_17450/m.55843 type:complete len:213 (+) Transcript_17450:1743-2381(+)